MNELSKALTKKVDIKNELPHLIKLLIDRIEITKVNNNRKHVRMVVYFNFNTDIIDRELDLYEKKEKPTIKVDVNSLQSDEISFNQKCSCIDQNIRSGLYENINVGIGNINDIKENDDSKCCRIHQNESSGEYRNTFKFIENPLNSIKQITKIDVNTNYDLIYDGVLYFNNSPVVIPNSETVVTKNVKKKRLYASKYC